MDELLPCPFCGEPVPLNKTITPEGYGGWTIDHVCTIMRPIFVANKKNAIKYWNTRAERTCDMARTHEQFEHPALHEPEIEWGVRCSSCKTFFKHHKESDYKYCPSCGAKVVNE